MTALGEMARVEGDLEAAKGFYEKSLELSIKHGGPYQLAIQYTNLSFVAFHQKDYQICIDYAKKILIILRDLEIPHLSTNLYLLASTLAALGYTADAGKLTGAADAQQEITAIPLQPADQHDLLPMLDSIRKTLDEEAYRKAYQAGYGMSAEEIYDYVLSDLVIEEDR